MSLANDDFSNFRSLIKSCGTLFSLFPVKTGIKLREMTQILQLHKPAHLSDTVYTIFCFLYFGFVRNNFKNIHIKPHQLKLNCLGELPDHKKMTNVFRKFQYGLEKTSTDVFLHASI